MNQANDALAKEAIRCAHEYHLRLTALKRDVALGKISRHQYTTRVIAQKARIYTILTGRKPEENEQDTTNLHSN